MDLLLSGIIYGSIIIFETHDCFTGQIKSESDPVTSVDFSRVNPATGPLEVEGAEPGDVLLVEIGRIEVEERGIMVALPGEGAFGNRIKKPLTRLIEISGGKFQLIPGLSLNLNPMIGVIGVSPAEGSFPCGEIGDHGGNLDARIIRDGARVYFKVNRKGAMLSMGDVHAGMGDDEALICGVEVPAKVEVTVNLIKSPKYKPPRPVVELGDIFATIGHGPTLDAAGITALNDMLELLIYKKGISLEEAAMFISATGDLRVCQIVDPQKTARV
ncbi:MAG: acetamidase/formamidase family protein [Spirochaetota bacterium]